MKKFLETPKNMAEKDIKFTHAKTGFGQELIYGQILISSFFFGFFVSKFTKPGLQRRLAVSSFGLLLIYLSAGVQILHSLFSFFMIYGIIRVRTSKPTVSKTTTEWLCFTATLLYLLFFRICHDFLPNYFNKISPFANVVQLIMTLRLISYGFEHSDTKTFTGFLDFFTYSYSYLGLFSGPFYRRNVFNDFINNEKTESIPIKNHLIETLKPLPLTVILYFALKTFMPVDYYRSESFLSNSAWLNVLFMQVQFAWCRYRFYTAWILAESTCISARLGAYEVSRQSRPGLGPKLSVEDAAKEKENSEVGTYDFNTIWNLKKLVCEFNPSIRQCMRDWNCSVQWWLANYTYKKVPQSTHIVLRISFTMFISAYWHGIAPGYFMGFMCVPLLTFTEDLVRKGFEKDFPVVYRNFLYLLKHWGGCVFIFHISFSSEN